MDVNQWFEYQNNYEDGMSQAKQIGINEIAKQNFDWVERMGWHNKSVLEALALVASEVGEAVNECRHEQPTEEFGEELADIVLRVLDIAHWQNIDLEKKILDKMAKNQQRGSRGRLK
jgi:NTP pyrophosphatase (non-canonical NTP hydrolase)